MLLDTLRQDMQSALKARESVKVETLRFLMAAAKNAGIAKYGAVWETSLTDADVLDVIKKQVKTHKESIDAFEKANRQDLVEVEKAQLVVLQSYAPKELTDEALETIVAQVVASGETNFGKLMGMAMGKAAGMADGGRVSTFLKRKLAL